MKITYNDITIPFFDIEELKELNDVKLDDNGLPCQVLVSLSGGCDSASALYLCLTHFPDIEWLPYTCRDLNAPGDADSAIMFIDKMQEEFPHANLQDIQVFEFDDKDPKHFTEAKYCIKHYDRYKDMTIIGMVKILLIDRITRKLMLKYDQPLRFDGMSKNPSEEEMIKHDFLEWSEPRRTHENNWPTCFNQVYQPFINVDKKFIADIYFSHPWLLKEIYPHTKSCTGTAWATQGFTRVCGKCFWCHERNWAFGDELYPIKELPEVGWAPKGYDGTLKSYQKIATANYSIESAKKKMIKGRKLLIVSGDSFTDNTQRSAAHPLLDCSWPKWPELLAEKLDMNCINLGRSGSGNKYIYSSLRDFIIKHPKKYNSRRYPSFDNDDIGLVIAGWSQCFRTDYHFGKWGRWAHERMPFDKKGDLYGWAHESLNYYLDFQTLCESKNLPYIHVQTQHICQEFLDGLPPTEQQIINEGMHPEKDSMIYEGDKERAIRDIKKFIPKSLSKNNFLGGPDDALNMKLFGPWPNDYVISAYDNHPNAEGNELIAQTLLEFYEEKINS